MKWWLTLVGLIACCWAARSQVVVITTQEMPLPGTITKDTVYYSKHKELKWSDFTGKVRQQSPMAAVSFTGFSYDAVIRETKDTILVHISLQTYFARKGSWVRPRANTTYALSHEQLHFNIAKLMEEEFKDSLHLKRFDSTFYTAEIQKLYWYYWRKMTKIQKEFDTETRNGENHAKEAHWENKINAALKKSEQ